MRAKSLNPFNLLAGPYALSWQNHIVFLVLALLSLGFFDIDRLGGNFASWFIVFVAGFSATVLIIEVGKRQAKRFKAPSIKAVYLLLTLVVTGVIRGLVVYEVGFLLNLIPRSELLYRAVSAPLFVLTSYVLSNALVASFLSYRAEARRLALDLQRLNESRSAYESDLQFVNQQQRNRVRELLSAPMWELQKKLETADDPIKLQDALLTMKSINTEVIRPLSHELSATVADPTDRQEGYSPDSVSRIRWPKKVKLSETQPAWLFFGVVLVLGLNSQIALTSFWQGIQIVAVSFSPVVILFWLEKKFFRNIPLTAWAAIVVSTAMGLIGSIIGGALATVLNLPASEIFWWQAISFTLVVKTTNLIYGIFLEGWRQSLVQLAEVNGQQRTINSRLRQQLWLGQKALAMELHGSVQATLQALALRLARMQEVNLVEISQVLEQVRKALSRIENQEYLAGQQFESLLTELKELWEGTASIDWEISAEAELALEKDPGLARCAFEVIRESVTNAVKHGSASEIVIVISLADYFLRLRIANNGSISEVREASLGSELMDQLCLNRSLRQIDNQVVLEAELALSPQSLQESLV